MAEIGAKKVKNTIGQEFGGLARFAPWQVGELASWREGWGSSHFSSEIDAQKVRNTNGQGIGGLARFAPWQVGELAGGVRIKSLFGGNRRSESREYKRAGIWRVSALRALASWRVGGRGEEQVTFRRKSALRRSRIQSGRDLAG